jgi:hypothetical protein
MTNTATVWIGTMCMLGATLHYLFVNENMDRALACLTIGTLLQVVGRLDRLIDQRS